MLGLILSLSCALAGSDRVVIVVADDLGTDELASYGAAPDQAYTPNLDAFAASGVRFNNVWATPLCSSTRATLWAGRWAGETGMTAAMFNPNSDPSLSLTEPSLFRAVDVESGLFGKWHLATRQIDPVTKQPIDTQPGGGINHPNSFGLDYYSGNLMSFGGDYFNWFHTTNGVYQGYVNAYEPTYQVDELLQWANYKGGSFLGVWSCNLPHGPFQAPPATHSTSGLPPGEFAPAPGTGPIRPYYKAMVEALDYEFGRLLDGLPDDTTVIFLADNGTPRQVVATGLLSYKAKGTLFEPGINVPMIIAGPGIAPGVSDAMINTVDIPATVCKMLGGTPPWAFDGYSFDNLLTNPGGDHRDCLFSEIGRPIEPTGYAQHDGGLQGPGDLTISCKGSLKKLSEAKFRVEGADPNSLVLAMAGTTWNPTPFLGGTLAPFPTSTSVLLPTNMFGQYKASLTGADLGFDLFVQVAGETELSNVIRLRYPGEADHYYVAAARNERYKMIWAVKPNSVTFQQYGDTQLMFDLAADPLENFNLLDTGLNTEEMAAKFELEALIELRGTFD